MRSSQWPRKASLEIPQRAPIWHDMPDGSSSVRVEVATSLSQVSAADWQRLWALAGQGNPFLTYDFLEALERSGCASSEKGWSPAHLVARDLAGHLVGAAPLYVKTHSYGEYVFDHAWADAIQRAGGRYYPKLQSAVPFTPVTGPRFLIAPELDREPVTQVLARAAIGVAADIKASSVHSTFLLPDEQRCLSSVGFLERTGLQFHWFNRGYGSFNEFLAALSSAKRKNLRKERERACHGLEIRRLEGADIRDSDWDFFFRCYQDTGARKWGTPYLNRAFFRELGTRMAHMCVLFVAYRDGTPLASALNLIGGGVIFGRYWGCLENVPFLHFELCYYQAIDYAIEHSLARVEAGAQGEHKLLRGYEPVPTFSSHWIGHPGLRSAVAAYLAQERPAVADEIEDLSSHTPFKANLS
jgi:uncharacterized protein